MGRKYQMTVISLYLSQKSTSTLGKYGLWRRRLYFWTKEIRAAISVVSVNTCATKETGYIPQVILLLHS